jgi:flagellar motor switch protein FliG
MNEMTKKDRIVGGAEEFVRSVLEESFGQKASKKTVRSLAEQVSRSLPARRQKGEPDRS